MSAIDETEVKITEVVIGSGAVADKGALVFINYEGVLEDGTVFDSTSMLNGKWVKL